MYTLKSFCVIWLLLCVISEILSTEYLHFGGTEEESRQAAYYLSADSGSNTGPTDELKRTQRSFWKKLFKNGLFGECENCCNNCNYNAGNGDNYSPAPSPLLPFQPWRNLPLWRPLQPLFSPLNYDNSYNNGNNNNYVNPPRYGSNGVNNPTIYENSVLPAPAPAPEPVYEIPTELPPAEPDYTPVAEDTYESPSQPPVAENSYSIPEPSTYTNEETPKTLQSSKGKVPQIIYQPIIYVSPQYQGNKPLNQVTQDKSKYDYKPQLPNYETESDTESEQPSYSSDADNTKSDDSSNYVYNTPEKQTPAIVTPCSQTNSFPSVPCLSHPSPNPAVSTVATVYNIITPSLLHSLTTGQSPYTANAITPNVPCANSDGPSKYSLHPSNVIPLDSYSLPSAMPASTPYLSPPPSMARPAPAAPPAPASYHPSYVQPMHLSSDDQPYRVCPELFEDYQRKLNTIIPHMPGGSRGSTFVNAQLIHY
ncbi:DNA-directed RNA polymerase II subunit RPB1-like [Calliphora vicina]|uniref:DNA-directed RNA polymerase II subunit RPB1-like n=1 Tax=Calliphora vicina TaxID=7373 RepID=UPI00325B9DB0